MDEEPTDEEETSRNQLYGHWNPPASGGFCGHVLADAIVDPEANDGADLISALEETCQYTPNRWNRQLCNVTRNRSGDCTTA